MTPETVWFAVEVYVDAPGGGGLGEHFGLSEIGRFNSLLEAERFMNDFKERSPSDCFRIWSSEQDRVAVQLGTKPR